MTCKWSCPNNAQKICGGSVKFSHKVMSFMNCGARQRLPFLSRNSVPWKCIKQNNSKQEGWLWIDINTFVLLFFSINSYFPLLWHAPAVHQELGVQELSVAGKFCHLSQSWHPSRQVMIGFTNMMWNCKDFHHIWELKQFCFVLLNIWPLPFASSSPPPRVSIS